MSESATSGDGQINYDVLDQLLPRYMRKVWTENNTEQMIFGGDVDDNAQASSSTQARMLHQVQWNPKFVAIPGCFRVAHYLPNYKELGYFPMDIASSLAIFALDLSLHRPCRVLDLCCCPGAKLRMIADSVQSDSTVVGVDISASRLAVCKSLLESWEELLFQRQQFTARLFLFQCDGTKFGSDMLGTLLYDSAVLRNALHHSKDHRKRKNKSSKAREVKRLRVLHQAFANISGINSSTAQISTATSAGVHAVDKTNCMKMAISTERDNTGDREDDDEIVGSLVDVRQFDYVLVDAECTHDASYRHMKYVDKGHKWKVSSKETPDEGKEGDSKLSLSHNIRDLKTSESGRISLQTTQRSLIENGFQRVCPGGCLVYSTCSEETDQNEAIVSWLLEKYPTAVLEDLEPILKKSFSFSWSSESEVGTGVMDSDLTYAKTISEEQSIEYCKTVCEKTTVLLQHGSLRGTVRVGLQSGMSGHFVARIKKLAF